MVLVLLQQYLLKALITLQLMRMLLLEQQIQVLLQIGDEVIKYTGASGGSITGITRGNNAKGYIKGTPVRKYELGGVSLARINRTHLLSDVTDRDPNPITFDSYTVKIDTSALTAASNWITIYSTK